MKYLPCYSWAVFLAAALICVIAWAIWPRRSASDTETDPPSVPADDTGSTILWLTPACASALGECAEPAVLARASPQKIAALLATRAHYPPGEEAPRPERYGTWPQQAAMLAAGRHDALRRWQRPWLAPDPTAAPSSHADPDLPPGGPSDTVPHAPRWRTRPGRHAWLLAALLLLLAALLAALLMSGATLCACERAADCAAGAPVATDPAKVRLELPTDAIFDYKMAVPYHETLLANRLKRMFARFEGIRIMSVEGHTDPIGSTADNDELGRQRAETVRGAIATLVQQARPGHFTRDPLPGKALRGGPKEDDADVWRACYDRFQLRVAEPHFRPLRNLGPAQNPDRRPPCTAQASGTGHVYPACAGMYDSEIEPDLRVYARQAENFRELTACLSPMRHVVVLMSYERQLPPRAAVPAEEGIHRE